jgi:CDP-6-deoxy-D-xylo-4-hexulose-3-dehydrase
VTAAAGFPTTVSPILQNGCVPVYVDVDPRTCNADPAQIEAAISGRTRAIMIAHTLGNPFDADAVVAIAKRHDLRLVEDNCDALGSTYRGRKTGTFGDLSTSSFYPAHHITMGEGGAVCTDSARLRKVVESFRDWGRDCWCPAGKDATCGKRFAWEFSTLPRGYDHKYVYRHVGYNLKPTDIQAAIGRVQLRKLETFGEARRRNFRFLRDALEPLQDEVAFMEPTEGADPSWFGFLVRLREPDHERLTGICRFLDERRIGHRRLMAGNLARQPAFHRAPHRVVGDLRHTDAIMNGAFFVGVYPGLTEPMLEYLAASITAAVRA